MKLSFEKNIIKISEIEDLKKYQIAQLEYYGFERNNRGLIKVSESIGLDIAKLLSYLEDEAVVPVLSANARRIMDTLRSNKNSIEEKFVLAQQVKNGTLPTDSFKEFQDFLCTLPRQLRPHQIKAAYHFYVLQNGANFSVPGSGKTSVILSIYEKLRRENKCNMLFVIGPPSCFQPWKNEFEETLGRKVNSIILSGGSKTFRKAEYYKSFEETYELYLCTYQTALNDHSDIIKFISQQGIKAFIIIDEAHYIKQIGGSWATSLLKIGKHAAYKGVLTGTPIPKSYKDIFNLFDFLWSESSPLTEDDKIQIDVWEKKKNNEEVKALLDNKIGPLFFRVRKKDLGLTKPVFHSPIIVKMNTNESAIYRYIKAKIVELAKDDYFKNEEILNKLWKGRMIRLRQAVSYPRLLLSAIDGYAETFIDNSELKKKIQEYDKLEIPGKLRALADLVLKLRRKGNKVLIWSNFIGTLELIKFHFISLGERCEVIYGKTPIRKEEKKEIYDEKTREDIRDEFVDSSSGLNILIANPAACAESISLHKTCFHAIYYDLSYNCAQYIQSLDRIHRVGGSEINKANYYFLQYENSLDQDIKANLEAKAQKMYDVIEQDYAIYDLDLYDEANDDDIAAYKRLFIK